MRVLLIFILAGFITPVLSVSNLKIDFPVSRPEFKTANISISVDDLKSSKKIYSYRSEKLTVPASTMKVITTATALEMLGPDFRYKTKLAIQGEVENGVLNGNIIIIGSGDPTLGSSRMGNENFLNEWVGAVRNAGINKISGKILTDESCFDDEGVNTAWTWEDIGNYFAPGIYGIAYKDNTLKVKFNTSEPGRIATITGTDPVIKELQIHNYLISSEINFDSAWFFGAPKQNIRYVRGAIPMHKTNYVVKADIPDPGALLMNDFTERLQKSGIIIQNMEIKLSRNPQIIHTHQSPTLSELITESNRHSNNFYTEQIFKSLSMNNCKPANNNLSVAVIRNFWKSKGLDISQLYQKDGSGLSPQNVVSADFLNSLMIWMYKNSKYKNEFINSLSVSGKTGTLSGMFIHTPLEGKVYGKSGTISKVRCYTGYIITEKKEFAFTVMVNQFQGKSKEIAGIIEKFLLNISKF
jgi:D-alanyl-D-alanine carboxypeptidase/D-alanyl-D-alanine-endopeptidase (penicillin-binding protein 4)